MSLLRINNQKYNVRVFDNHFALLENESSNKLNQQIGEAILKAELPFIDEIIATEVEICLKLNEAFKIDDLKSLQNIAFTEISESKCFIIPVCFENQNDWSIIEDNCSISKQEYILKLLNLEFEIAMFGFLPGFVYMNGLPPSMHVPRKSNPEIRVKANSLAIGEKYLGFYSLPSPGGWNVIGTSPVSLLQIDKLPPIIVSSNATFKLKSISIDEYDKILNDRVNIIEYNGFD